MMKKNSKWNPMDWSLSAWLLPVALVAVACLSVQVVRQRDVVRELSQENVTLRRQVLDIADMSVQQYMHKLYGEYKPARYVQGNTHEGGVYCSYSLPGEAGQLLMSRREEMQREFGALLPPFLSPSILVYEGLPASESHISSTPGEGEGFYTVEVRFWFEKKMP